MENRFASKAYKVSAADLSARVFLNRSFKEDLGEEDGNRELLLHFHTQYEIFFVGESPLVMQIGEAEYSFCHTAVCISPFVRHFVKTRQGVYGMRFELKEAHPLFTAPFRELSVGEFSYECLLRAGDAYRHDAPTAVAEVTALLSLVFLDLYNRNLHPAPPTESHAADDYCLIIDDFVNRRYEEQITLADVAGALHLGTKQTSRIIRSRYRTTLSAMLNEKRLTVAAFLLAHTDESVTAIAERLFRRSDNYFYRLFRARFGISPLQYRKAHGGKQE